MSLFPSRTQEWKTPDIKYSVFRRVDKKISNFVVVVVGRQLIILINCYPFFFLSFYLKQASACLSDLIFLIVFFFFVYCILFI